jgi:hypothetical protein
MHPVGHAPTIFSGRWLAVSWHALHSACLLYMTSEKVVFHRSAWTMLTGDAADHSVEALLVNHSPCPLLAPRLSVGGKVASPGLEGGQVAVLRHHAASARSRNGGSILLCEGSVCAPWHKTRRSTKEAPELPRTPFMRSSQPAPWTNFRLCEAALLDQRPRSARHGSGAWATGCFEPHVSARTPPQSISAPARKTSVFASSSRTPRKKVLYVRVLFGSPET